MWRAWKDLTAAVPGSGRGLARLTAVSFASALLEAGVLVLVVLAALGVTDGAAHVELPAVGWRVEPSTALLLAFGAGLVGLAGHLLTARLQARLSSQVAYVLRDRVITAFRRATWDRQAREREGSLQETATSLATQSSTMAMHLTMALASATSLAALLLAAFVVDPVVTLAVVGLSAVVGGLLRPLMSATRRHATATVSRGRTFAEDLAGWVSMAMDLRVFGVHDAKAADIDAASRRAAEASYRARRASRVGSTLYKDLALLLLVAAVAVLDATSDVDLASVGSVLLLVVRSVNYAQQTQSAMHTVTEQGPALDDVVARVAALEADAERAGTRRPERLGTVELRGVGYDYEPGRVGVDGIDLTLAPGAALGVIGPSGGGKSTLVQVLLRLRRPTRGSVLADGAPYDEVDPDTWSRLVSLVPQEPRLIEGTVAENIAFFRPWILPDALEAAAAAAHVLDDIRRLPEGMATRLGPRGAGLSGGQKQRVAIARALVGRPQLLVLDEPSSALDPRSELLLQETIRELTGHITLVIVAHRMETLRSCDRILVLSEGRAEMLGPRDEVLRAAPFLRRAGLVDEVVPEAGP